MSAVCKNHNNVVIVVIVVVIGTHERTKNGISEDAQRGENEGDSESPAVRPLNTIGVGVASDENTQMGSLSQARGSVRHPTRKSEHER